LFYAATNLVAFCFQQNILIEIESPANIVKTTLGKDFSRLQKTADFVSNVNIF